MSDAPHGPGWWQASDGRWYPPAAQTAQTASGDADDVLPSGPPPGAPQETSGKATASLVLAIASFFTCPILAIIALVLGSQADREIRESYGRIGGEGTVKAGRIVAILDLVFSVVMIPVLLAIAIPTFLGAQERAQDRAAQSDLRNAFIAEVTFGTDAGAWTDDPATLASIEPTLRFEQGTQPVLEDVVYVVVNAEVVGLSAKSASGTCFYVLGRIGVVGAGYAEDEECGGVETQEFLKAWE